MGKNSKSTKGDEYRAVMEEDNPKFAIMKDERLKPYRRYTSLRRFKKANPFPYSSKGWSVWDEIQAQNEENKIMALCHWSARERFAYEYAQVL